MSSWTFLCEICNRSKRFVTGAKGLYQEQKLVTGARLATRAKGLYPEKNYDLRGEVTRIIV